MTVATPTGDIRNLKLNIIGLERNDYKGNPSTLCPGCGHDSISSQIIAAAYEAGIPPYRVAKLSGIGCSSKSPAYFLNKAHGFNTLHGRMPSVATGATVANSELIALGVSGDGDTGSIGIGQYKHLVRRNVPMVYIIENNGVYGLTKGQFSATSDEGQVLKYAGVNELPAIDLCVEALVADCGFVARSFAGDAKQVRELLKAAFNFRGTAVLDIISPCVTFNNHDDSNKSYAYGKAHEEPLHDITFVPAQQEITVDYAEGTALDVTLHDGATIHLKKLGSDYTPTDRIAAIKMLEDARAQHKFITGLIFVDESRPTLHDTQHLPKAPLAHLPTEKLRPTRQQLEKLNAELL